MFSTEFYIYKDGKYHKGKYNDLSRAVEVAKGRGLNLQFRSTARLGFLGGMVFDHAPYPSGTRSALDSTNLIDVSR